MPAVSLLDRINRAEQTCAEMLKTVQGMLKELEDQDGEPDERGGLTTAPEKPCI
jgi:hypothetical protein